ncbi:MAG: ADP-forming succinate--CoA ligase subunit beta [Deltaproteobacteria bacterium]|nr:MAG: ADP-forming succinate--CoA ligase subunit beta [Deltaproteobacteria bacterium]
MKVHEYQAKEILRRFGVPVPPGQPAFSVEDAVSAAEQIGGPIWVVKSQIHAGGRGKGRFVELSSDAQIAAAAEGHPEEGFGGVQLCRSLDEVREAATKILGHTLVTKQTGPEGKLVNRLYIEGGADIAQELYCSVMLDRSNHRVMIMASAQGGTDIEDVAEADPTAIKTVHIDPAIGLGGWQGRTLALELGLSGKAVRHATSFFQKLVRTYVEMDCDMLEINPLVVTGGGELIALDCKMSFDGNALYRHKDVSELRDLSEEDAAEVEASEYGLSFVNLDGTIGCLVNGAGLAMSTMDIIKYKGGEPANFLDVGGGAKKEQVVAAFKLITKDPRVNAILVNIFGGIMKCDVIAEGVLAAVEEVGLEVPLVVRLSGTNAELGRKIIDASDLNVITATDLNEAGEKAVQAAKGA